jgi:hypothetical protein
MDAFAIDLRTRDISSEVLDEDGRLRILPAAYWATTTVAERGLLGHRHALYGFPTVELVEHLREIIGDRKAIEIGAGSGVLAEALGIVATDNHQQEVPKYRALITAAGQPVIRYGSNVVNLDAIRAVRRYRPDVVVGCWVTHKYDPHRAWAGGNEVGIDEEEVLASCQSYVLIGNERVHQHKKIWAHEHTIEYPPFVYSRALNGTRDFIATWPGTGCP